MMILEVQEFSGQGLSFCRTFVILVKLCILTFELLVLVCLDSVGNKKLLFSLLHTMNF